jgi:Peptidase family M48
VLVGPDQLSSLHNLLAEAATTLHMEAPDLYVRQHPVPNAYTLAYSGRKPFIVIHTALLELLTPAEIQVNFPVECIYGCKAKQFPPAAGIGFQRT